MELNWFAPLLLSYNSQLFWHQGSYELACLILELNRWAYADPGIFVRGGPGQSEKKSSDNVFFFFSPQLILQMVNFKEIHHFSRFKRGSNIFQGGGGGGGGGVQLLILY